MKLRFFPLLFFVALVVAIGQGHEILNFKLVPPTKPPAGASSVMRDVCANYWALVPAENKQKQLLVLPAQAPTAWVAPNIHGITPDVWQSVSTDDDGFVWLKRAGRTLRFDPRKIEAGAVEATPPAPQPETKWQAVARMPASNHDLTAAVLDGRFYVAGGLTADWGFPARSHPFDGLWELNPANWSWRVAAKLYRARIYCATAAFDNKVWVLGGDVIEPDGKRFAVTTTELCDPRTGKVTTGPASSIARPMPLALTANGRLYVMGNPRDQYEQPGKMESIGVGETAWRQEPDGPAGMGPLAGTPLADKLYVLLPKKGLAIFDTKLRQWEMIVPPSIPRSCQMAAYRGEIWLLGGQDITDKTQTLIFNPATREWRNGPQLPRPNSWGAAATVNGKLIVTGGAALRSETDRAYIYNDRTFVLRD